MQQARVRSIFEAGMDGQLDTQRYSKCAKVYARTTSVKTNIMGWDLWSTDTKTSWPPEVALTTGRNAVPAEPRSHGQTSKQRVSADHIAAIDSSNVCLRYPTELVPPWPDRSCRLGSQLDRCLLDGDPAGRHGRLSSRSSDHSPVEPSHHSLHHLQPLVSAAIVRLPLHSNRVHNQSALFTRLTARLARAGGTSRFGRFNN